MHNLGCCFAILLTVPVLLGSAQPTYHHSLRQAQTNTQHLLDAQSSHEGRSSQSQQALLHLDTDPPVEAEGTFGRAITVVTDPGHRKEKYELLGWASLIALFAFITACGALKLVFLIIAYRSNLQEKSFSEYLTYSLETWFISTYAASAKLMTLLFFLTVLLGMLLAGAIMKHKNPFSSLWYVLGWVLDPGSAFGLKDIHVMAYVLSAVLGIFGILMLALLLALTQDAFNNTMEQLHRGESAVIESGHIMIIGFTEQTTSLLQELCNAHKSVGGDTIVVLSGNHTKSEMDANIAAAEVQMHGSRIVTRCGKPHSRADLRHVAAHTARTIILLPKMEEEIESRDAFTLRTLIILRGQGWPHQGRIVAVCSEIKNYKLFQDVGGDVTDIMMVESFIAKLMTRCSKQSGLSSTLSQVFGTGVSDFFISAVPKDLCGLEFSQASNHFPGAVLVGVLSGSSAEPHCHLCPGADFVLEDGQEVVLIAADLAATQASSELALAPASLAAGQVRRPDRNTSKIVTSETILIFGWNELAGTMILELEDQVAKGTELIIIAETSKEEREKAIEQMQVRWKKRIGNMKISQLVGKVGSRHDLEDLGIPVDKASRIFLLASHSGESSEHVDACTVTAILQIRDMLVESGVSRDIAIIPEIKDPLSRTMCAHLSIADLIDTSALPSKILAMVACQPRIQLVLNEIISQTGTASFSVCSLAEYYGEESRPTRLSFQQMASIVGASGDVAIGWSKPFSETSRSQVLADIGESVDFHNKMSKICKQAHGKNSMLEYELNPGDKTLERDWVWEEDKIVILTCSTP